MHSLCYYTTPTTAFVGTICLLYNEDTFNICIKEFGSEKNNFLQNDSCENLDNFSLIGLLYMHRWCLHGPINSYYSF